MATAVTATAGPRRDSTPSLASLGPRAPRFGHPQQHEPRQRQQQQPQWQPQLQQNSLARGGGNGGWERGDIIEEEEEGKEATEAAAATGADALAAPRPMEGEGGGTENAPPDDAAVAGGKPASEQRQQQQHQHFPATPAATAEGGGASKGSIGSSSSSARAYAAMRRLARRVSSLAEAAAAAGAEARNADAGEAACAAAALSAELCRIRAKVREPVAVRSLEEGAGGRGGRGEEEGEGGLGLLPHPLQLPGALRDAVSVLCSAASAGHLSEVSYDVPALLSGREPFVSFPASDVPARAALLGGCFESFDALAARGASLPRSPSRAGPAAAVDTAAAAVGALATALIEEYDAVSAAMARLAREGLGACCSTTGTATTPGIFGAPEEAAPAAAPAALRDAVAARAAASRVSALLVSVARTRHRDKGRGGATMGNDRSSLDPFVFTQEDSEAALWALKALEIGDASLLVYALAFAAARGGAGGLAGAWLARPLDPATRAPRAARERAALALHSALRAARAEAAGALASAAAAETAAGAPLALPPHCARIAKLLSDVAIPVLERGLAADYPQRRQALRGAPPGAGAGTGSGRGSAPSSRSASSSSTALALLDPAAPLPAGHDGLASRRATLLAEAHAFLVLVGRAPAAGILERAAAPFGPESLWLDGAGGLGGAGFGGFGAPPAYRALAVHYAAVALTVAPSAAVPTRELQARWLQFWFAALAEPSGGGGGGGRGRGSPGAAAAAAAPSGSARALARLTSALASCPSTAWAFSRAEVSPQALLSPGAEGGAARGDLAAAVAAAVSAREGGAAAVAGVGRVLLHSLELRRREACCLPGASRSRARRWRRGSVPVLAAVAAGAAESDEFRRVGGGGGGGGRGGAGPASASAPASSASSAFATITAAANMPSMTTTNLSSSANALCPLAQAARALAAWAGTRPSTRRRPPPSAPSARRRWRGRRRQKGRPTAATLLLPLLLLLLPPPPSTSRPSRRQRRRTSPRGPSRRH